MRGRETGAGGGEDVGEDEKGEGFHGCDETPVRGYGTSGAQASAGPGGGLGISDAARRRDLWIRLFRGLRFMVIIGCCSLTNLAVEDSPEASAPFLSNPALVGGDHHDVPALDSTGEEEGPYCPSCMRKWRQ